MEEIAKHLRAMTLMQLQLMSAKDIGMRPELLLVRAGFTHQEIGRLLGKSKMAIAKAVSRANKAPAPGGENEP